ncbi:hypothetical protein BG57_04015 [Caballeronia grimmiae]|uniref:Uncharacterized protein n=1 Tax=Caballeronia grimmiae TaxID=1071679 RepID=A0A069P2J9_9BURK|nr:hypothetical protein BG57_04015 [Caballeronia grimmiae]GGD63120.1 hypothetical protein GCM10010985_16520 [Caballeronia grimmiae]
MQTPARNTDLRHVDTSGALTLEERRAVLRQRQREALGLTAPRVEIGKFHVPACVARQFAYLNVSPR